MPQWLTTDDLWVIFGLLSQTLFFLRFLVQWLVSEKKKQSVIPLSFWYFSLAGGVCLLIYALHKKDPVFIVGQSVGIVIYIRNLALITSSRPG
ncbi:MAG: lipid A biosynthesis protein [Elusimicrobia bacterium RIFOXYA2_FULL_58_8]|nr:MAG: lipid A biosynthesis protein [Elusimicrobia bacterium RIFOXYA12_FULL_57_11]OGS12718.1 MAG: lipid A biosynthesis protein [Elusimicrobia bacterium RIFOXYA2_FULL_58_8]